MNFKKHFVLLLLTTFTLKMSFAQIKLSALPTSVKQATWDAIKYLQLDVDYDKVNCYKIAIDEKPTEYQIYLTDAVKYKSKRNIAITVTVEGSSYYSVEAFIGCLNSTISDDDFPPSQTELFKESYSKCTPSQLKNTDLVSTKFLLNYDVFNRKFIMTTYCRVSYEMPDIKTKVDFLCSQKTMSDLEVSIAKSTQTSLK